MNNINGISAREWDYYHIVSEKGGFCLSLCYVDNRLSGLVSAALMDFNTREKFDCTVPVTAPMGKLALPKLDGNGSISYKYKYCDYHIDRSADTIHIHCTYLRCFIHTESEIDVTLKAVPGSSPLILGNGIRREVCLRASGTVRIKGREYIFKPEEDFGYYSGVRTVHSRKSLMKQGSGAGYALGKPFGFYLSPESSLNSAYTYNGIKHELNSVDFAVKDNIMLPWKITASGGAFEAEFKPDFNDRTDYKYPALTKHADRLFGRFDGHITNENGEIVEIKNIPAFFEMSHNKY